MVIIEVSSILVFFQTLELISQSLQPSQNRAQDPRGTPEHRASGVIRPRPWDLNLSSGVGEVVLYINPTCSVEAELETETALALDMLEE